MLDPAHCPHLGRTSTLLSRDGVQTWRCLGCGTEGRAESWREFDDQAGCTDWRRRRCKHVRFAELRAGAR